MSNTTVTLSETAERAAWAQAKNKTVRELAKRLRALREKVAGLGYLSTPGHASEAMRDAEIDAKIVLSEANAKITEQVLARNKAIAQTEYEDTYATARLEWELKKQGLLNDLDEWLAEFAQEQDLLDEDVAREALAVDARRVTLIAARADLEMERRGIEAIIATYDRLPLDKQRQLAQARLETVTQRLSILPYLKQLLDIETDIINEKVDTLFPKQAELVTVLGELISRRIADVLPLEAAYYTDQRLAIADKEGLEGTKADVTTARALVTNKRLYELLPQREALVSAQGTLDTERRAVESARLKAEKSAAGLIAAQSGQITGARTQLEDARAAALADEMNNLHPKLVTAEGALKEAADTRLSAQPALADAAAARLAAVTHAYDVLEPSQQLLVQTLTALATRRLTELSPKELTLATQEQNNAEKKRDWLMPLVMTSVENHLAQLLGREADVLPLQQANAEAQDALALKKLTELLPAQIALEAALAQLSDARYNTLVAARAAVAEAERKLVEAQTAKVQQRIAAATVELQTAQARLAGVQQEFTFIARRLAIEDTKRQLALAEMSRMRGDANGDIDYAQYQLTAEDSAALTRALIETGAVPAVGGDQPAGTFTGPAQNILELTADLKELEDQWRDAVRRYSYDTQIEERRYPQYARQHVFASGSISGTARHSPPGTITEHYGGTGFDTLEGEVMGARDKVVSRFRQYNEVWTQMLTLLKTEPL